MQSTDGTLICLMIDDELAVGIRHSDSGDLHFIINHAVSRLRLSMSGVQHLGK